MKTLYQSSAVAVSLILLLCFSCGNEKKKTAEDEATKEVPEMTEATPEVVFENDYSKVSKITLAQGEYLPTHEGENRIIYSLTDYTIDWEENGENLGSKSWKKGDVHFHEAGTHAASNNSSAVAEWLVFTKKTTELPDCEENTLDNDVITVAPDFAEVRFENGIFKVTEVTLPKGEKIAPHSGVNRIVYSLSDYSLLYNSDEEGEEDNTFKVGDIHWHSACMHSLENSGETDANYLVISYKK
jgi:quercetin dioxygenase-like cupin family protein